MRDGSTTDAAEAVDEVGSVEALLDVGGVSGAAGSERLVALERLQCRLDAARLELVGRWDGEAVWSVDGSTSGAAWMAPRLGLTGAAARERVKVARWLRGAPLVAAALAEGRLSWAKVVVFARWVVGEACVEAFAGDEAWLVQTCEQLRPEWCSRLLRHWASHVDPEGAEGDEDRRWEQRSLHLAAAFDGMGDLRANLTPEALLVLEQLLDRIGEELFRDEDPDDPAHVVRTPAQRRHDAFVELLRRAEAWDADSTAHGRRSIVMFLDYEATRTRAADEARRAERSRTAAQGADADLEAGEDDTVRDEVTLVPRPDVASLGARTGAGPEARAEGPARAERAEAPDRVVAPGHRPPCCEPTLGGSTEAPPEAQRDQAGTAPADGGGGGPPGDQHGHHDEDEHHDQARDHEVATDRAEPSGAARATRWDGPMISRAVAHRWLCDADVARLLVGPEGEVLDHGRSRRLFSLAQRRAMIARQGGRCAWPDCDRPAGWLQAHHLQEWDRDRGCTDLDDGVACCTFHHHAVHDRGFAIRRDHTTGELTFHRPDGTEITSTRAAGAAGSAGSAD